MRREYLPQRHAYAIQLKPLVEVQLPLLILVFLLQLEWRYARALRKVGDGRREEET